MFDPNSWKYGSFWQFVHAITNFFFHFAWFDGVQKAGILIVNKKKTLFIRKENMLLIRTVHICKLRGKYKFSLGFFFNCKEELVGFWFLLQFLNCTAGWTGSNLLSVCQSLNVFWWKWFINGQQWFYIWLLLIRCKRESRPNRKVH